MKIPHSKQKIQGKEKKAILKRLKDSYPSREQIEWVFKEAKKKLEETKQ